MKACYQYDKRPAGNVDSSREWTSSIDDSTTMRRRVSPALLPMAVPTGCSTASGCVFTIANVVVANELPTPESSAMRVTALAENATLPLGSDASPRPPMGSGTQNRIPMSLLHICVFSEQSNRVCLSGRTYVASAGGHASPRRLIQTMAALSMSDGSVANVIGTRTLTIQSKARANSNGDPQGLDPAYAVEQAHEKYLARGYQPWVGSMGCWG